MGQQFILFWLWRLSHNLVIFYILDLVLQILDYFIVLLLELVIIIFILLYFGG